MPAVRKLRQPDVFLMPARLILRQIIRQTSAVSIGFQVSPSLVRSAARKSGPFRLSATPGVLM